TNGISRCPLVSPAAPAAPLPVTTSTVAEPTVSRDAAVQEMLATKLVREPVRNVAVAAGMVWVKISMVPIGRLSVRLADSVIVQAVVDGVNVRTVVAPGMPATLLPVATVPPP